MPVQASLQDKCWSVYGFSNKALGTYVLKAGRDTVANEKTYYYFDSYVTYIPYGGFMREEGSKIYLMNQPTGEDMLLYDFSLGVGDSIRAIFTYPEEAPLDGEWSYLNSNGEEKYMYITAIETMKLPNGEERKVQIIKYSWKMFWVIDGIGSIGGLWDVVTYSPEPITPIEYILYCCSEGGEKLYQKDRESMSGMPGLAQVYCGCEEESALDEVKKQDILPNAICTVYSANGTAVLSGVTKAEVTSLLHSGLYIIHTDIASEKIVIR